MRLNGLMIGFSFALPYHVMRCAAETGIAVHVHGSGPVAGLRWSRFCAGYHQASFRFDMLDYDHAAYEIRRTAIRLGADILFPSDDVSTRLLATIGPQIGIRTSALPDPGCFDLLNDKWSFYRLCVAHGARTPETRRYHDTGELRRAIESGRLAPPFMLKPPNRSGSVGVQYFQDRPGAAALDAIDYRPILAQRFIQGREVGINVVCRHGTVIAHAIQERRGRSFRLLENADLLANVTRVVAASRLHGPANFDAIIEERSGLGYILECNPRFWYTIYMSKVLGLDFVGMCIDPASRPDARPTEDASVRLNGALLLDLVAPWTYRRADWRMLRYHLSDPIPYWCEKRGVYDDRKIAVPYNLMTARRPRLEAEAAD